MNPKKESTATQPTPRFCTEKYRLLDEVTEAIKELASFQDQQLQALISGDPDFARFDLLIQMAQDRKRHAKYEYLSHVEQHRCN